MSVIEKFGKPVLNDTALTQVNELGQKLANNGATQGGAAGNAAQSNNAPVERPQLGRSLSQKPPGRSL